MQDPAEVVKITYARFCISYPGLAPISIGGLSMQNTLLSSPKHPIWSASLTPGPLPQSPLHNLTACFPCFIHPLLLILSNESSMLFFCRGTQALLTYILSLPLIPLPLLILFVHLLLLSCHAELPQVIRQNETVAFHEFASDILIL